MNLIKKIVACAGVAAMLASTTAMAANFTDMPDGKMGLAIENAISNGLINGFEDNTVRPNENITRAQMATIITRAFGVIDNAKAEFGDVLDNAWYKDAVEKAVYMGAFQGDDKGNFNPENNITFQETYTVLARVFQYVPREVYVDDEVAFVPNLDINVLSKFSDADAVADWAEGYAISLVAGGGYTGFDGKLKPTEYITRGEFAMMMDELVSLYIDEEGTYTSGFGKGAVVIRNGNVIVDGIETSKNIIVGYGAEKNVTLKNVKSSATVVVYGGRDRTPVEVERNGKKVLRADEKLVDVMGHLYDVRIISPCSEVGVYATNLEDTFVIAYEDTSVINYGLIEQ